MITGTPYLPDTPNPFPTGLSFSQPGSFTPRRSSPAMAARPMRHVRLPLASGLALPVPRCQYRPNLRNQGRQGRLICDKLECQFIVG